MLFLVCRPDLPVADPKALVAMLQAKPDGYSYGSPGVGTAHHLLVELIRSSEPFSATHVPYLGSAKAVVDLMEGRFDFMFLDAAVALAPLKAGKLKVLAVTGAARDPTLPEVPPIDRLLSRASTCSPGCRSSGRPACRRRSSSGSTVNSTRPWPSPSSSSACARSGWRPRH